jgi:DNA-binding SARP family transcriptional activator/predicted ATPase
MRIELLGKLRFLVGSEPLPSIGTNRLQSLLAFLVLHRDAPQSREHLAFLLWPESAESQARTNLRQLLHHLRRALPVDCSLLEADNQTVRWRRDDACSVDVVDFEAASARGAEAEKNGDFISARQEFEEAARLYQDDLLPELYDQWLEPKREQLRHQFADVLGRLSALLDRTGDFFGAIRHATRLISLDPLRESSYQALMRLHARNNDRSAVLRVYHQCMRTLQRELGVSPSKATQDLFTQALKAEHVEVAPAMLSHATASQSPLVGRTREWERLLECWRRASQGGMHFALILGEPGIGKSRLADELFQFCARSVDVAAARACCYVGQGQLAYGPIAEWLRAEPMRSWRAQLPKPQLAELARVLPEIMVGHPEVAPPQPLTESWQRRHFYEALHAAFRCDSAPLLLLIDDLHWCDRDSFEWLHSFFRSEARGGILVLGTARPEETGRDHPLAGLVNGLRQSGQLSEFALAPLSQEESAALAIQTSARDCDPAFLSALYQTTRGNPLFVVESVRDHVGRTPWSAGGPPVATPPRIQAVIAARLAQLSPSAYELAGLASTIGRPFSFELLAKATDWDEDSVSRALEELWQRRIIGGSSPYDFTHNLLREVAYAELSPVRRRSWHRRVARALEELYGSGIESVSSWLAVHYEAAGLAEEAIRSYRAAAEVAKGRFADTEAASLLRRALALCQEFPESAKRDRQELELLVVLGPTLVTTHGYAAIEAGETYEKGLLLARRTDDRTHTFSLLSGAWAFHVVHGHLEESQRLGQQWMDSPHTGPAGERIDDVEMAGHFLMGISLFHLGDLAGSLKQLELAQPPYGRPTHPALALFAGPDFRVSCRSYLSQLHWQFGEAEQSEDKSEESIALARELAHPFALAIALDYAAMLDVFRLDSKRALARASEASELCRKHGFAYYLAWAEILAGWAIAVEGEASAGLARLRQGIDQLKATGAELRLPFYYGLLAEACKLTGQIGEALANIATGFAFQSKNGEVWFASELHRIHGDVLQQSGDARQARISYQRAIETARQIGARMFERRAEQRLARKNAAER